MGFPEACDIFRKVFVDDTPFTAALCKKSQDFFARSRLRWRIRHHPNRVRLSVNDDFIAKSDLFKQCAQVSCRFFFRDVYDGHWGMIPPDAIAALDFLDAVDVADAGDFAQVLDQAL